MDEISSPPFKKEVDEVDVKRSISYISLFSTLSLTLNMLFAKTENSVQVCFVHACFS